MWSSFLLGLLSASVVVNVVIYQRAQSRIRQLERSKEAIQVEENLVFDFLHGLGEAFTENTRPHDLHRLIVEGAARILNANGGALYMTDRTGAKLAPAFISKGCPPLAEVPAHILQQAGTTPIALESYLRLHAIDPGEGIIGRVWEKAEPVFLTKPEDFPEIGQLQSSPFAVTSALVTPLFYGNQHMGVLALANGLKSRVFTPSDFVVFKSIAEQSAFALYNAIVYSEVNEKKRLDHDLGIARDIQRILLPSEAPVVNGFQISGINIPARQVSGDYFDYIHVDDEHLGLAIADVSGKGVPASLIMAMCRSVLRSQASANPSAADVLHKVNRQLFPDIKEDMFISMAYVILDFARNGVTLCRAGHDAPLLYKRATQTVTKLNPPGMALGIDSGDVFDRVTGDFSVQLERDDCLILYTDGVTEALDSNENEFGLERMIQAIRGSAAEGAPAIIARLTEDLRNFAGVQPQYDDITLIAVRKT